jgi:hypothetical protein
VNFLKRKSETPDPKNVELLAWLIDFPNSPWEWGKEYVDESHSAGNAHPQTDISVAENEPKGVTTIDGGKQEETPTNTDIPADPDSRKTGGKNSNTLEPDTPAKLNKKPIKRMIGTTALSLFLGIGGIWWWQDKNPTIDFSGGCMYWVEDHYEPIACNQKMRDALVIALDSVKLKTFRKILVPDTITYNDIGKVWYLKINGKIEYYTSGGEHPVVFDRQLKPITKYIIDKHIMPGTTKK